MSKKKEFQSCKIEMVDYHVLKKIKEETGQPISRLISNALKREYKKSYGRK